MFELTSEKIVPPVVDCPSAGGFVCFEGRVRKLNEGREVLRLEYEAYAPLAHSEGESLLKEAQVKFNLNWVHAIHRVGILELGDIAVWIGCAAAHRKEAFAACEFIIDELKERLPIWKKESYADGESEWVDLRTSRTGGITRADLFDRHLSMPEVGPSGQAALQDAAVVVVGAGGLGNGALPYLAAAGVGRIGIVEPDLVEVSNLHRQVLFGVGDLGRSKAQVMAERLRQMHPYVEVKVYEETLDERNAAEILGQFDVVIDGTDRFDAKFLMSDTCQQIGKPLVQASIFRMEGVLQTILPGGPCLRCQWPVEPQDGCVRTCAEAGVLGVLPGLFGSLQAAEAIKIIIGLGENLANTQILFDLRDYTFRKIGRVKRAGCPGCCQSEPVDRVSSPVDWEVTKEMVLGWEHPFTCLDIRELDEERNVAEIGQARWVGTPLSRFKTSYLTGAERYVIVCASGVRSGRLVYQLREEGFDSVFSLRGGMRELA